MEYNKLPQTDIEVSKICLGTMTWGQQNTESEGFSQMDYALDQGVNFFDTAELYSIPPGPETYGATETIIGNWFKSRGKRDQVILASKIAGKAPFTRHIRTTGFTSESLHQALNGSLRRLQTDYIDLYQLHWPERTTNFFGKRSYQYHPDEEWQDNIYEVLSTLQGFVKSGKVRHVGLSNETPWGVMRFIQESQNHDLPRPITVQNPYSLLNRTFESGLAEFAMRENIKLLAYSPLGFGTLSGKFLNGNKPANSRITLFPQYTRYISPNAVAATERYAKLAREAEISFAQMSLAFVISRPFVTSTIIGATTMEQLKENLGSMELKLSEELVGEIDQIQESIPNPAP